MMILMVTWPSSEANADDHTHTYALVVRPVPLFLSWSLVLAAAHVKAQQEEQLFLVLSRHSSSHVCPSSGRITHNALVLDLCKLHWAQQCVFTSYQLNSTQIHADVTTHDSVQTFT